MSGLTGIASFGRELSHEIENVGIMTRALCRRGNGAVKIKNSGCGVFGESDFEAWHKKEELCPVSIKTDGTEYTICFDGLLYNSDEIKNELKRNGASEENPTDAYLVLLAYLKWGSGCVRRLSGIFAFAIWDSENRELFLARDRFGIKPLYYCIKDDCLYFASEIKGLLAHPRIDAVLDKTGLCEVMGLGPAQTQGCGIFKGIYEILPAHCATYNKNGFNTYRYWQLVSEKNTETFEECLEHTKKLVFDAIDRQLSPKGRNLCMFLSGGLDSSSITALAAKKFGDGVSTFSLRYKGNDEFFKPTAYQPAADDDYISQIAEMYNTKHEIIEIGSDDLLNYLTDAVEARDLPGMGDVDSSLYFLCSKMGGEFNGALSGECADEVFGGYPWFHRKEDFEANVFPWAKNVELRRSLISPGLINPNEISDYIYAKYNASTAGTPRNAEDSAEEARRREIAYLNLNWFMYTLGARSERIGMNCGLEIRMPYCDHRLVEYVWNIPWNYKAYEGREKGLLRMVFDGILPEDVLWRKKSPFPKTHNPEFEDMAGQRVLEILSDKNSPVCGLINEDYIFDLMRRPSDYGKPWFGQLMATPQLYSYIIQLNHWLKKYNIKIEI